MLGNHTKQGMLYKIISDIPISILNSIIYYLHGLAVAQHVQNKQMQVVGIASTVSSIILDYTGVTDAVELAMELVVSL